MAIKAIFNPAYDARIRSGAMWVGHVWLENVDAIQLPAKAHWTHGAFNMSTGRRFRYFEDDQVILWTHNRNEVTEDDLEAVNNWLDARFDLTFNVNCEL